MEQVRASLSQAGLTGSEVSVYLALLRLGESSTGPIIKHAGIATGKAYLVLDKLAKKGMVTHAIRSGVKHYRPQPPENILSFLDERIRTLQDIRTTVAQRLPELHAMYAQRERPSSTEVYEGERGFRAFHDALLSQGKEILVFGVPHIATSWARAYLQDWMRACAKRRVKLRVLCAPDAIDLWGETRRTKGLRGAGNLPSWTIICGDTVAICNLHGLPECFVINNPETAHTYHTQFERAWGAVPSRPR